MFRNDKTPLPKSAKEILEIIEDAAKTDEYTPSIQRDRAEEILVQHGYDTAEAADQIEGLLNKGYLYEVGDELRVTPRD